MSSPAISIIIVTYRREAVLVDTVRSVLEQMQNNAEMVIVDQTERHLPETDDALRELLVSRTHVRWYRVGPASTAAARNFGLAHTTGDLVVFFDDDVVLHDGCLQAHVDQHARHPKVGAITGRVEHPGQSLASSLYAMDTYGEETGGFNWDRDAAVGTVNGANMSYKRRALLQVGTFDPSYKGNGWREESDLAFRVMAAGWPLRFAADAFLLHKADPEGGARAFGSDYYASPTIYANETLFFLRRGRHRLLLPFLWRLARRGVLRGALLRRGELVKRIRPFAVGIVRGVRLYRVPMELQLCVRHDEVSG